MIKSHKNPKFILRDNLGKLARNLRFLGYDAAVYKNISFHNTVRIAAKDKRIIITRSRKESFAKIKPECILIVNSNVWEQMTEIKELISYNPEYAFSRCSKCNKILYEIDKNKIINFIPEFVWNQHNDFRICRSCGSVYWQGDHYNDLVMKMKYIFEEG